MNLRGAYKRLKSGELKLIWVLLFNLLFLALCTAQASDQHIQSVIHEGIEILFEPVHVDTFKAPGLFQQGDDIQFKFTIRDTLTMQGISGAAPAAWLEPQDELNKTFPCAQKISAFIGGSIFTRAELDLNVYYVLTLNEDASITVVDPLFGFGGTQLLSFIELKSPGYDWQVSPDQQHIYVSSPGAQEVSIIQTADWRITNTVRLNARPYELLLQKDEEFLWASYSSERIESYTGVAAISTRTNELVTTIETGEGQHKLAISDDDRFLYASNSIDQTISIIDIATFSVIETIGIVGGDYSMAWSEKAGALYVAEKNTGIVYVIDGEEHILSNSIETTSGISQIRFDPTGRLAFIINTEASLIHIIDAALNRVVQTGDTELHPDQVIFSDELAYVRHKGSEIILMFPLDQLGVEGQQLQAADFPSGDQPPGAMAQSTPADGMVQAPGANAMLISNPGDKMVYYYLEGMAAPMGQFSNYGKVPKAVAVIDRSLEERLPGTYSSVGKLRGHGTYDVAFFIDVPRVTYCFTLDVKKDQATTNALKKERLGALSIEHLLPGATAKSGQRTTYKIKLVNPFTNELIKGLKDVTIRSTSPSNWFEESAAIETPEEGVYECSLQFPESGIYYVYVACPSRELYFDNPQYQIIRAH